MYTDKTTKLCLCPQLEGQDLGILASRGQCRVKCETVTSYNWDL